MSTSVIGIPAQHALLLHPARMGENKLLACLSSTVSRIWEPHLELVNLDRGQILYESEDSISYAYFPLNAVIAKLYMLESGASAESALIGREGMVGFPLVLGGGSTTGRAEVLIAGDAWRVKADFLKHEVDSVVPVMHLMLRFLQALMTQIVQTGVCNRFHSIEQQLCRWLLLITERLPGNEFSMTQELIAIMLGVRRESITEAARQMRLDGLIRYARGHIVVLNRIGLESRACECYKVVRHEYGRLLPVRLAI